MKILKCYRDDCRAEQQLNKDSRQNRSPRRAGTMSKEEATRAGWKKDEFGWTCPKHR